MRCRNGPTPTAKRSCAATARYLLHAAKLRFGYRVWQRDATTHEFTALIRSHVAGIREASLEGRTDDALADELRRRTAEARLMAADVRELRQGVEVAGYNMSQIAGGAGPLTSAGPFADDKNLAEHFLTRLDDELGYLDIAAERAAEATDLLAGQQDGSPVTMPGAAVSFRYLRGGDGRAE
ncbi:MAG: CATRA conflict system CASPASE/TPR repeat-associated protein [Streptosporangiaceae bacterium]